MKHKSATVCLNLNSYKHLRLGHLFLALRHSKLIPALFASLFLQQLFAQPVITSFSPLSGLPGSTLTIYGNQFSSTPLDNIVSVGGARAYVITASSNKLTVRVPRGITNKPVSVTVNHLTGFSAVAYITTYKTGNAFSPGSFATAQNFYMGARPIETEGLTIEDLDGDGKPDIYTTGQYGGFVNFYAAYRNISSPEKIGFATPVMGDLPFSYTNPELLTQMVADINGDGKKDILSRYTNELDVVLNTSTKESISFNDIKTIYLDVDEIGIPMAADLNADGKTDIYFYDNYYNHGDSIFFARNTSSGDEISFARPIVLPLEGSYGPGPEPIVLDFNEDQQVDILYPRTDSIVIRINSSKNGIVSFNHSRNIVSNNIGTLLGTTDINKDGKPDIVLSSSTGKKDSLRFLLNTSTAGNINFSAPVSFPFGTNIANVRFVDINGDGKLDITGYKGTSRDYVILKNTSTAKRLSFASPVNFPAIKSNGIEYGDFDGDGRQDLAYTVTDYLSSISVLRNQTDTARGMPLITSFSPTAAMQNDTIAIDGDNFNSTTNITLGGTPVQSFKIVNNNQISAVVDKGATGDLQISTSKGVTSKARFTYLTDTTVKLLSSASGITCSDKEIRVKAVVSNAYKGIIYKWYKNNKLVSNPTHIYLSLPEGMKDGDSLWCVVSFASLPTDKVWKSDVIKFNVNRSQRPRLYIQSNKGKAICEGTSVTFKAVVINGDFKQVYEWQKNNVVVGDTTDTYIDSNLQNGDIIRCTIEKAQECTVLPVTASLQMTVDQSRPPAPVSIIGPDEVSPSQSNLIFSVLQIANARNYKWQIPRGASFISENGTDSVKINWSDTTAKISVGVFNTCGASPVITKTVRVNSSSARITTTHVNKQLDNEAESIIVYPNPANSKASVISLGISNNYNVLELRDLNGKLLLHQKIQNQKGQIHADINTSAFAAGVYYILLIDKNSKTISKRLVITK